MSEGKGKGKGPATNPHEEDEGGGFPVEPRTDCPHVKDSFEKDWNRVTVDAFAPCAKCGDTEENWRCLGCQVVLCSRYKNAHMATHAKEKDHPLAISHADLSSWCTKCEDYFNDPAIRPLRTALYFSKFGQMPPDQANN